MSWPWEHDCFPLFWSPTPLAGSPALFCRSLELSWVFHSFHFMLEERPTVQGACRSSYPKWFSSLYPSLPCHVSSCCREQILLKVRQGSGRAGRPAASVGPISQGQSMADMKGYNWRSLMRDLGVACGCSWLRARILCCHTPHHGYF